MAAKHCRMCNADLSLVGAQYDFNAPIPEPGPNQTTSDLMLSEPFAKRTALFGQHSGTGQVWFHASDKNNLDSGFKHGFKLRVYVEYETVDKTVRVGWDSSSMQALWHRRWILREINDISTSGKWWDYARGTPVVLQVMNEMEEVVIDKILDFKAEHGYTMLFSNSNRDVMLQIRK